MVHFNANLDLKTMHKVNTQDLNTTLSDICENPLYITLVAREEPNQTEAWQDDADSFFKVVLPYRELLESENSKKIIVKSIIENLEKLNWLDISSIRAKLLDKFTRINS